MPARKCVLHGKRIDRCPECSATVYYCEHGLRRDNCQRYGKCSIRDTQKDDQPPDDDFGFSECDKTVVTAIDLERQHPSKSYECGKEVCLHDSLRVYCNECARLECKHGYFQNACNVVD